MRVQRYRTLPTVVRDDPRVKVSISDKCGDRHGDDNGLNIAGELADAPGEDVLLACGLLRGQSLSLQGG